MRIAKILALILGALALLLGALALFVDPIPLMASMSPKATGVEPNISAEFPYESRFVEVHGSKMHYVEQGQGRPILLVHGNPTSSYLWRNVIPHLSGQGRVIAVDLIGFGKSDKPNLPYRFADHARYLSGFIEAMKLKGVTLVLHDWGGGVGIDYWARNQANVRAIVAMEAVVKTVSWSDANQVEKYLFGRLRDPADGQNLLGVQNLFVESLLPMMAARTLTGAEMKAYRAPFPTVASRKPVAQWPREIPFDGVPADNDTRIAANYEALQKSDVPLLLLYAEPGMIFKPEMMEVFRRDLPRAKQVSVGSGMHYLQETQPTKIGKEIAVWLGSLP